MKQLALLTFFFATGALAAPRHYTMNLGANRAGGMTVTQDAGTTVVDFEFNDRGRGPKSHAVYKLAKDGLPVDVTINGNDYLKSPVSERFTMKDGVATWKNDAESGTSKTRGFYVSMNGAAEEYAMLARALLKAPGKTLALLPAGQASISKLTDATVTSEGKKKHVTAYAVTGLGFSPEPVWLDDDGELFANASSWAQIVADPWMPVAETLVKTEEKARDTEIVQIAQRLTHKPKNGTLVVTNARLFDPATLKVTPNTTIVVRGDKIEAVGTDVAVPSDATRIDAAGKTVIPGLWDMHVHLSADDGLLNIANGVTTVRDLANDIDFLTGLRKKFDDGSAVGPHVLMAGFIEGPGPYAGPTKVLVSTPEEAVKWVDKYKSLGYEQIKIYSSVKPELVPVIAKRAHELGLRVSGHVPAFMRAEDAVRDGYDEIQHANFLMLQFWPDVKDTRTPARFTAVAERGAALDFSSPEARAFIDLLKQHHTVSDPTVSIFEGMFTARKGEVSPTYAAIAGRLPPQVRRGTLTGGLPVPEGKDQLYRDSFKKMLELVGVLYREGITIVAGTDDLAGFTLHRELENYVRAGIPPAEVLRIATLGAATVMHHEKETGSVTPGKIADFDIVDGDPTTNISDVRKVRTVVKAGNVFDAAEVDKELGVLP
ncbi:MAG TPA: amidohydrolase family protein [Thermoanaerobaculia bacterium]|nr:amidohydrolase family protein [Thermoanaerobaculia bacterium]